MTNKIQLAVAAAIGCFLYQLLRFYRTRSKIDHVPTLGSDGFFGSLIDLWRIILTPGDEVMKRGYRQYRGAAFKMRTPCTSTGWFIFVSGEKMIEELKKAPTEVLSLAETTVDNLETEQTLGKYAHADEFQIHVVRTPLTRALNGRFSDLCEELTLACDKHLPKGDDWQELKGAHSAFIKIIAQTSNRLFVGTPLCRNREYLQIQEDWTIDVFMGSLVLHMVPQFLKPLAGMMLSKIKTSMKRTQHFLGPKILDRIDKDAKLGREWEGRPLDLVSWLLDYAPPESVNVEDITARVMFINFAAIHTTSLTLSAVMFWLAARREYHQELREEIKEMIQAYGWTKEAMGKMQKLDSFVKESMRLSGISSFSSARKALKNFTFSNGLTIPAGYTVAVASSGIHSDPELYEDPDTFKGYRFYDMARAAVPSDSSKAGTAQWKNQVVSLDPSWFMFGHGRNACPGRFFAINETKALVAHMLLNYDVKLPGDATEPEHGFWFAGQRSPSATAGILFKRRKSE